MTKKIALPTVPRTIDQEMYQYFIQLQKNIQILEQRIAALEAKG